MKDEPTEAPSFDQAAMGAKEKGAYYTPKPLFAAFCVGRFAVQATACLTRLAATGVSGHAHSVGIEQCPEASAIALCSSEAKKGNMNSIIWLVGAVVIVVAILSLLGLH